MGCGQSSISDGAIITPYKLEAKTSRNSTQELKQERQTQVQTTHSSKVRREMKDRLTDQEIQTTFDKFSSNIPMFFDGLSERISSYYMDLSVQTIELLSYQRISQVETKIYLSEQFLLLFLDIMRVIGKKINHQFQINTFKSFNDSQSSLINYIKQKYPRAGAVFVPGDLMQTFKTFSMVQNPENDILRRAGISFMNPTNKEIIKNLKQFFNCLIDEIDSKFPVFQNLLTQRIFSYESEGKKKVFNYKIGRKLPQNMSRFDPTQNDQLNINSPQLFRMIIKWVTDIEQFFTSSEDEINEKQTFKVCEVKGEQVYFDEITPDQYLSLKQDLKNKLKETNSIYKEQIENLLEQMHMFNANLLRILFTTQRKQKYVPQSQAQIIKYAMFNTKIVSWMMAEKLISVLKNLIKIGGEFEQTEISRRLDLIKFNVKDLLRAMVIGNKRQILTVYDNLKKLEQEGALKIIQIKNRLGTPLNDAMVIFTIKQSFLICELQLVLSEGQGASEKLKSIELLNHFLYQLVRSPYGVLSEVAVLLGYKDTKINYEDKISFENKSFSDFVSCNQKHPESVTVQKVQSKPFICSQCTEFYEQFDNIFGYKKCHKCFIYQCCKCMFKKNKDYEENQVHQRFVEALSCQISEERTRKSNFNSLSKQLTIEEVLKLFHEKKMFLKNMFPRKNYQKIQPKDIHAYIKQAMSRKNENLSFIPEGKSAHFLLVQFKGESVYIKCLFWNQKTQEIQNSFDKYDNFYESKVSSSFYDFLIFFNTQKQQELRPNQIQKDIKICIKPDIPYHSISKFYALKYATKTKYFVLVIGTEIGHKAEGTENNQQQGSSNKKDFKFSSIAEARKSLPTIGIVLQNFQMKNQGITTPLLDAYFKTYPQKIKIRTLNLSNNKIVDVSIILKECVNVEHLIIAKNYIKQIKIQTALPKLQKLLLFENKITSISGFKNTEQLQKINLQDNRVQTLEALNLPKLIEIIITNNGFVSLAWLQKSILPQLQYLVASNCGIKEEFENNKSYTFNLPKVKKINYSGNPTKSLKLECPELKFLECGQCSLKNLEYSSLKIEQLSIQTNFLENFSSILSEKTEMLKKIQCSNAGNLTVLPKIVAQNLQSLNLPSCNIENLDNLEHSKMPKLVELDINYNNEVSKLPSLNLLNLKIINLYGIRFKSLSDLANSNLPLVEDLHISGDLNISIQQLPTLRFDSLKKLRLENFNFSKSEAFMKSDLPCLQILELSQVKFQNFAKMSFNKLTTFSSTYSSVANYGSFNQSILPELTSISFTSNNDGNPLADAKCNLQKIVCPKLTDIYIYNCKDININQFLSCEFPCLNSLFINSSQFSTLPVLKYPQITTINVCSNEIENIDGLEQSQLPKIETIELNNNKIKKLPRLNFASLKKLILDYNEMQQLHRIDCSKIYSSHLESSISISSIAIKNQKIRTDISKLPALSQLSLTHNKLSSFPVLNLESLQIINIGDNPLKSLSGLGKSRLKNLVSIEISNCLELQQKSLPEIDLPKVDSIRITQCSITNIDKLAKSNLNTLKTLYLESLDVVSLPVLKLPELETFTYNGQSYYGEDKVLTLKNIDNMSKWQCPKLVTICLRKTIFEQLPVLNFPKLVRLQLTDNASLKYAHNIKTSNLPELDDIYLNENPLLEKFEMVNDCLVRQVNLASSAITNSKEVLSSFQASNLYLFNNEITSLAPLDLTKTEYLNADSNKIQQFSPCFQKAYKLSYLSLSNNNIKQIPDFIFPELATLQLSQNQITVANIKQKNFPVLETLNLQKNKIASIEQISPETLTSINLSGNLLKSIQCFNKNPDNKMELSELRLQQNEIQKIVSLPKGSSVYLTFNKLTNLNWIANSKTDKWTYLYLANNQLTDISGLFRKENKFNNLYSLELAENKIKKFEPGPNSCKFPYLSYITLNNNQIQSVNNIGSDIFPTMTYLNLSVNKILKFGPNVSIKSLTSLYLSNNEYLEIKGCDLPSLSDLMVDHCNMKSLQWVNNMKWPALTNITANDNQIKVLPKFEHVPNISNINVTENPIENIDGFLQSNFKGDVMYMQYSLNKDLPLQAKKAMVEKLKAFKGENLTCSNPELNEQEGGEDQMIEQQQLVEQQQPMAE